MRRALVAAIEADQKIDILTDLPNEIALKEELARLVDTGERFWVAFVEIDRFKSVNDEFGYDAANEMLVAVSRELRSAEERFAHGATAFRAHGDEFYILGMTKQTSAGKPSHVEATPEMVHKGLDAFRECIKNSHKVVEKIAKPMACTVSIGWLLSSDMATKKPTSILKTLEIVVSEAKRGGRDKVVRFDDSMKKNLLFTQRGTCTACYSAFSVDIPREKNLPERKLQCPNCGAEMNRDPMPDLPPEAEVLEA